MKSLYDSILYTQHVAQADSKKDNLEQKASIRNKEEMLRYAQHDGEKQTLKSGGVRVSA